MTTNTKTDTSNIILTGLDGSNPLAFLAALGTLRTLSLADSKQDRKSTRLNSSHYS